MYHEGVRDQLPLKTAARPPEVEARDLNRVEERRAECISCFRIQCRQALPKLLVAI